MPMRIVGRRALPAGSFRKAGRFLVAAGLFLMGGCRPEGTPAPGQTSASFPAAAPKTQASRAESSESYSVRARIGFRAKKNLDEHFAKHGREFRGLNKAGYLLAAQTLRDRPVGGDVEEIVRSDGTASRFDRASGAFLAFNRDGTIRTFFKPNDGERYFRRQAQRSH